MYCTKCGRQVPDESRRCPHCGCDLSFETDALLSAPPRRSKTRKSHAGAVITVLVFLLTAAELVWFFGISPVRIRTLSRSDAAPASAEGQGVVNLIPTFEPQSVAEDPEEEFAEPTPTPFVTPAAAVKAVPAEEASPAETSGEEDGSAQEEPEPQPEEETEPEPEEEEPEPQPEEEPEPEPQPEEEEPQPEEEPEEAEPQAEPSDDSYILPESSDEPIDQSALEGMSAEEARIARNEIYARHGLIFQSEDLQEYFSSQAWYSGTVSSVDSIELSEVEAENIQTIVNYEAANGYNQD